MSLYKRGKIYWIDVYVGAGRKRKRKSTGTSDLIKARMIEQSVIAVNRNVISRDRAIAIIDNVLPEESKGLAIRDVCEFYYKNLKDEKWLISDGVLRVRLSIVSKFAAWAEHNTRVAYVEEVTAATAFEFSAVNGKPSKTKENRQHDERNRNSH